MRMERNMMTMKFDIWVEPQDRSQAIMAYRDLLSDTMIKTIEEAPASALIHIQTDGVRSQVRVVEEG